MHIARWSSLVARWAHNPKVVGSNPALATTLKTLLKSFSRVFCCLVVDGTAAEQGVAELPVQSSMRRRHGESKVTGRGWCWWLSALSVAISLGVVKRRAACALPGAGAKTASMPGVVSGGPADLGAGCHNGAPLLTAECTKP